MEESTKIAMQAEKRYSRQERSEMLDAKFVPQFNITMRCNMYRLCD